MFSKVVKSLPAMRSRTSRLRVASRRRPDAVIEPFGNAIRAASARRSGVSGLIVSKGGNVLLLKNSISLFRLRYSEEITTATDPAGLMTGR
jgi:hypothetical protein